MKKEVFDSPEKQFVLTVRPTVKIKTVKNKFNDSIRYEIYDDEKTLAVSFIAEKIAWEWAKDVVNRALIEKLNK